MSRYEVKSPIVRYFLKLSKTPKPDLKKAKDTEIFNFRFTTFAWKSFFILGNAYHHFLTWLTQYHPFSLLFPWQLFHANNKVLRVTVDAIEADASQLKIPIAYRGWDHDQNNAYLYFKIYRKVTDIDDAQRRLEEELHKHSGNVYVRYEDKHFKVILPIGYLHLEL